MPASVLLYVKPTPDRTASWNAFEKRRLAENGCPPPDRYCENGNFEDNELVFFPPMMNDDEEETFFLFALNFPTC